MRPETLTIATLGGFGHTRSVLDEVQGDAGAQVAACAPVYEAEDIAGAASHPACREARVFDDYRRLLEEVRPDVVIIGTRLDRIAEAAIEAAQRGCHLICEKPLALSNESLGRLYEAVAAHKVNLTAMLSMKNKAAFRTARALYRDGTPGEAVVLNVRKSYKWNGRPAWFGQRRFYGDTFGWVGIHAFSIIHFVTGAAFVSLSAMASNRHHPDYPDCQDCGVVSGVLDNGAYATISLDLFRPRGAATWGDDWLRLVGTRAVLEANASRQTCRVMTLDDPEDRAVPLEPEGTIYRAFLETVRTGAVDCRLRDEAFGLTYSCLCARQAAETGRAVQVETPFI
jgi:predicted dehydrogenase